MAELIDPVLSGKLDAYTVPALPPGFAAQLVAAALNDAPLPKLRRGSLRRGLRGGVTGLGVIAVGMISISAAAMGYFGEPIRHAVERSPVVGKVIERVLPKTLHRAKPVVPARVTNPVAPQGQPSPIVPPVAEQIPADTLTRIERRQRIRAILADPEARQAWIEAHPRAAQRIALRRAEFQRRRAEAGFAPQASRPLHQPMRWLLRRERLTPMERQDRIEQMRERRQLRKERRRMLRGDRPN